MARKSIAEVAREVLIETDNGGVMHGDSGLLDLIAGRCGIEKSHPLDRWKAVLAGLERRPDLFRKSFIEVFGGKARNFTLVEIKDED